MLLKSSPKRKYLSIDERQKLIKDIQDGIYVVKNKQGKILQKKDLTPFINGCETIDILDKLADVSEIGSGSYGKAYRVCTPTEECQQIDAFKYNTYAYSIKEIKFFDYATYNTSIDNPDRYENTEIRMLQFLTSFVTQKATPHINLPIMSWICIPKPHLHQHLTEMDVPKRYIVSELADYGDCLSFLALHFKKWYHRPIIWKVIFFQLLHTFAVIHKYFPNFLHNDFKPDNILVRSTTKIFMNKIGSLIANDQYEFKHYYQYDFNDVSYYIPDVGFQILLWDFDFASIAGHIENDKVMIMIDEGANLTMHKNRYYDIAMFFNLFIHYFGDNIPDEIYDWIQDYVINKDMATSDDERILENIEYTTPEKLLETPLFDEFRKNVNSTKIKEKYNGEIKSKFKFSAPQNLRYNLPNTCEYGEFTYIVPKNLNKDDEPLIYRINCRKTTDKDINIENINYDKIRYWTEHILNLPDVITELTKKEQQRIIETSMMYFKEFCKYYHISGDVLYGIAASSIIYTSYITLLSYMYPFHTYKWWIKQAKLTDYTVNKFIDVYKQYCIFVAKYIE